MERTKNDVYVSPYTKEVHNHFDTTFYGEVYRQSIAKFSLCKTRFFNENLVKNQIKRNPNMRVGYEEDFSKPSKVRNYFRGYYLYYDRVPLIYYDTSIYHSYYEDSKNNLRNSKVSPSFSWHLNEFKKIRLHPRFYPSVNDGNQIIADVKDSADKKLKDGSYVMYYEPIYVNKTHSFLTKVPYCYFNLKNHKPNGKAIFLTPSGDTLAMGKYINGLQEGSWKIMLPCTHIHNSLSIYFCELSLSGKIICDNSFLKSNNLYYHQFPQRSKEGWCKYSVVYHKGKLDGDFEFKINDKIRSMGSMNNNRPVGNWKYYYENGQLASSFHLRQQPLIIDNIIYPNIPKHYIIDSLTLKPNSSIPPKREVVFPIGSNGARIYGLVDDFFNPNENENENFRSSTYYLNFYKPVSYVEKSKFEILLVGWFKAFYENGKPYFKMNTNSNGELTYFSPKVYDSSGKVLSEWNFNKKKNKAVRVEYEGDKKYTTKIYLKNGKIYYH